MKSELRKYNFRYGDSQEGEKSEDGAADYFQVISDSLTSKQYMIQRERERGNGHDSVGSGFHVKCRIFQKMFECSPRSLVIICNYLKEILRAILH